MENERMENLLFEKEIQIEKEEKRMLVQQIINESKAAGFPLPASVIQLMNSNNGKMGLTSFFPYF